MRKHLPVLTDLQPQPAVQAHSRPIIVQGHSYYPVQVLALKLWLALDIVFGLAGPEETQQYARLGVKGAQGNLSFIAFANQVSKYRQMFAHLETVSLLPATEVFIRGLKDSGMQECARSWLRMQGPMNPLQLAEKLETEYANQVASATAARWPGYSPRNSTIELNLCTLQSGFRGRAPGPAVAAAWAHLSGLTALTMLNVSGRGCNANFSAGLLVPLARACGSRLRVLLLDACVKRPGELAVLLPACTGLAALDLSHSGCRFSTDDLSALAGLSRLEWLQLQHCKPMLRDDAVAALVQLRQLQQLDLRDNDLSLAGTRALLVALAGAGGQLTELRMGGNFDVTGRAKAQLAREFVHVAL
ncbi:hypothetical protein OEZ85_010927 [Tetradesmus obliquus]|uniref:Uncharacterized protein n=1 Tax=Tetradesmus obliquus TaxID=3088 RepID=A0ABY8TTG0_TETOB|nr:hypothetical protein OEZ85_010927 [Tetradesmus obliquus]